MTSNKQKSVRRNPDIHIDIGSHNARGGKSVRTNPTGKFHVETKMHRAGFWEHDPQNVFPTFKAALRFAREAQHQGFYARVIGPKHRK